MSTYKIVRKFADTSVKPKTLFRGFTLEEAREHCNNPQTSSTTCTDNVGNEYTRRYGPWFDCYYEE